MYRARGGGRGKAYGSLQHLPSKFVFIVYCSYGINSERIKENLESGSLFPNSAPSLYTHCRAAGVSTLVRGAVTSGFMSKQLGLCIRVRPCTEII